jgi:hypothetical protein
VSGDTLAAALWAFVFTAMFAIAFILVGHAD